MMNKKKYLEQCCDNLTAMNKTLLEQCKRLEGENCVLRDFVNFFGHTGTYRAKEIMMDVSALEIMDQQEPGRHLIHTDDLEAILMRRMDFTTLKKYSNNKNP